MGTFIGFIIRHHDFEGIDLSSARLTQSTHAAVWCPVVFHNDPELKDLESWESERVCQRNHHDFDEK